MLANSRLTVYTYAVGRRTPTRVRQCVGSSKANKHREQRELKRAVLAYVDVGYVEPFSDGFFAVLGGGLMVDVSRSLNVHIISCSCSTTYVYCALTLRKYIYAYKSCAFTGRHNAPINNIILFSLFTQIHTRRE